MGNVKKLKISIVTVLYGETDRTFVAFQMKRSFYGDNTQFMLRLIANYWQSLLCEVLHATVIHARSLVEILTKVSVSVLYLLDLPVTKTAVHDKHSSTFSYRDRWSPSNAVVFVPEGPRRPCLKQFGEAPMHCSHFSYAKIQTRSYCVREGWCETPTGAETPTP